MQERKGVSKKGGDKKGEARRGRREEVVVGCACMWLDGVFASCFCVCSVIVCACSTQPALHMSNVCLTFVMLLVVPACCWIVYLYIAFVC